MVQVEPLAESQPDSATFDPSNRSRYTVAALAKGLSLLSLFSKSRTRLRLSQLANETGIPLPTAYRLVVTLEQLGYLERLEDGAFRPSIKTLSLGFAAVHGLDVVQLSREPLARLQAVTKQTVNLGQLIGNEVLYLVRMRNTDLVTASLQIGSRLPAAISSMGKVLLAFDESTHAASTLASVSFSPGYGPNAVTDIAALKRQLVEIQNCGYAIQDEEVASGLRSIAAPVRGAQGQVVAAVNVAVQAGLWDIEMMVRQLREPLLEACEDISTRLGGTTRSAAVLKS
jgi:IclR family pca regulon transcriptional regulator